MESKLKHKDVWTLTHQSGLVIEICNWDKGGRMRRDGVWNYYIYIYERLCPPSKFEPLWLEDKLSRFSPTSPERVSHDYTHLLPDAEWHHGLTFYMKHGHSTGHRVVQLGCDFNHYWDEDQEYTLEDVLYEAENTADLVAKELGLQKNV